MRAHHPAPCILVVDKSEAYRQLLTGSLAEDNLEIVGCSNGAEALRKLGECHCRLVICTMVLDDMEGVELCLRMRQLKPGPHTPFVLATSSDSAQAARAALPAGVTEIFNKSAVNELVAYVRHFLKSQCDPMQGHVLLVEDNLSQRRMQSELFKHWGLTVDACETAEEAWQKFEAQPYDLVVTDIVLSGVMSGLDFISRVRSLEDKRGEVPILAITGFDDASRRIELFNLGVSDYATKPIIGEELIARVRNLITHWHHRRGPQ